MIEIVRAGAVRPEDIRRKRDAERPDVTAAVAAILADVRNRGDAAVLEYTERFDGAALQTMAVTRAEMAEGRREAGREFCRVLEAAAENIRDFHKRQLREGFRSEKPDGVVMGQRFLPIERVGVYVPGGTAVYPSTVLMDVIPAKIAGVREIILVTPPRADGGIHPGILAAASVAGADVILKAGGAQAIAALAYGTESIPKADKIVGPGNLYVATAKKMVYGEVDIDMIAGPSDVLIIADETADASFVAADLLAQAEHDENAAAILVTVSEGFARRVKEALTTQLERLERREIAAASIRNNGRIFLVNSLREAVNLSDALAPEHLEICAADPFALMDLVKNAGSIFLGNYTPEALGDYFAGPNHTLPTAGTARFYSPLSVDDFRKKNSYLHYSAAALAKDGGMVELFAKTEGLTAHANSISVRTKQPTEEER